MNGTSRKRRGRAATVAIWALTILLTLQFMLAGGAKLFPRPGRRLAPRVSQMGSAGLVGASRRRNRGRRGLLLLIPRLATIGGVALAVTMIGASATHALHAEWSRGVFTMILVVLSAIVARSRGAELRWPRRQMAVAAALQFAVGRAVLDTLVVRPETTDRALWGASCPRQGNLPTQLGS